MMVNPLEEGAYPVKEICLVATSYTRLKQHRNVYHKS